MTSLAFWLPILFLFAAALLGAAFKRRARDHCLKRFEGAEVFARKADSSYRKGKLRTYAQGLELLFDEPRKEGAGQVESLVFHQAEIEQLQLIARPAPAEGSIEHDRWLKALRKIRRPGLFARMKRGILSLYNMVRDAFGQAINALIGALAKDSSLSDVKTADKRLSEMSHTLTGVIPNSWEPVLEAYRGRPVVIESGPADARRKEWGILEDYSIKYLLVRQVDLGDPPTENSSSADQGTKGSKNQSTRFFDVLYLRGSSIFRHGAPNDDAS